jgi:hypothetical protein
VPQLYSVLYATIADKLYEPILDKTNHLAVHTAHNVHDEISPPQGQAEEKDTA